MLRAWDATELSALPDHASAPVRVILPVDVETVGRLFWRAFGHGGTEGFDDQFAAEVEVRDTLAGKWGPMVWEASLCALIDGRPAAASIVVLDDAHGMRPLLAFLVTDPVHQQQGLGAQLVSETLMRLTRCGIQELHLAVESDNPARRLYARLGFRPV